MITHCSVDHCRGGYMREFSHKTIKGVDIPNKDGYLPELRRLRMRYDALFLFGHGFVCQKAVMPVSMLWNGQEHVLSGFSEITQG